MTQRSPKSTQRSKDVVAKDFIRYLREDFTSKSSWVHPTTGEVYLHERILKVLENYKSIYYKNYNALFAIWLDLPRSDVSERFMISSSTLKRRWEQAAKDVILMLYFPELVPEDLKIY
jgi:integrase